MVTVSGSVGEFNDKNPSPLSAGCVGNSPQRLVAAQARSARIGGSLFFENPGGFAKRDRKEECGQRQEQHQNVNNAFHIRFPVGVVNYQFTLARLGTIQ